MTNRFVVTSYVAALLITAVSLAACAGRKETAVAVPEVVRDLPVSEARLTATPDGTETVGTVKAAETAPLAAQIMGTVTAITVREGDRVKRYQELFEKKAVSPQEFDEVKARAQTAAARRDLAYSGQQQAKAALAEASTMLGYTRVRAPFDGVVTDKRVELGAMAVAGMPLLTVERSGGFRLEANVDENKLLFVHMGQLVTVKLDALAQQMQGKVVQIVPAVDPASRSFTVKVELPPNAQLHSGLFGRAIFAHGERQSLMVPRSAVLDRGQLQGVYVLGADRVVSLRYITLGRSAGDQVEVLSGLMPGESLVTAPGARDLGGKRIQ
jgi:RND family efflux transporter MFP subunit